MLLNYLYTHFHEEKAFAKVLGTTLYDLRQLNTDRVFPSPSYFYESAARSTSFVSEFADQQTYRFHLKGHSEWYRDITQLGLDTEARARAQFFRRYEQAKTSFLSGALGSELQAQASDVPNRFNEDHAEATWAHFLNGVYGVCTRDGRPETVFLKQVGVMFIEQLTAAGPEGLSQEELRLLRKAVDFLDRVESDFAPHEALLVSRQRCIVEVRQRFLTNET